MGIEVEVSELACRAYITCCLLLLAIVLSSNFVPSLDFFLLASSDIAVGLKIVNFVYLTGGWLTQFTPTMEEEEVVEEEEEDEEE